MRMDCRNSRLWTFIFAFTFCLAFNSPRVGAQYFGGGGFGFGFNNPPPEIGFINSKSLLNASQATMGPVQNNVYANNPNAYINRMREPGLLDKWDVNTRRSIEASIGRFSDGPPPDRVAQRTSQSAPPRPSAGATAPAKPAGPIVVISSFFDRYQKLQWPDDAPIFGKYEPLRTTSDLSTLAALNEFNLRGLAQVSTVTDARAKLLDYGRPALQYIRDNSTPRIADSFHLFLLSLYESLAQAATIPKTPSPAANPGPAPR